MNLAIVFSDVDEKIFSLSPKKKLGVEKECRDYMSCPYATYKKSRSQRTREYIPGVRGKKIKFPHLHHLMWDPYFTRKKQCYVWSTLLCVPPLKLTKVSSVNSKGGKKGMPFGRSGIKLHDRTKVFFIQSKIVSPRSVRHVCTPCMPIFR